MREDSEFLAQVVDDAEIMMTVTIYVITELRGYYIEWDMCHGYIMIRMQQHQNAKTPDHS